MTGANQTELGDVQRTLFFPLLARARETERKHPLLSDPKAVELVRAIDFDPATYDQGFMSFVVLIRTMILDWWVSQFLAAHPDGTVVELGTGLNTRFERTDNGSVHWIDLDLPDTIELRRRFFADTERRRMIAASLTDEDWLADVARRPGPYFFVSDGVLVYLREQTSPARSPGSRPASLMPCSRSIPIPGSPSPSSTRWPPSGASPRGSGPATTRARSSALGLVLAESATVTRPPAGVRAQLPARYRLLLPLADPVLGRALSVSLFRSVATPAG